MYRYKSSLWQYGQHRAHLQTIHFRSTTAGSPLAAGAPYFRLHSWPHLTARRALDSAAVDIWILRTKVGAALHYSGA